MNIYIIMYYFLKLIHKLDLLNIKGVRPYLSLKFYLLVSYTVKNLIKLGLISVHSLNSWGASLGTVTLVRR